MKGIQYDQATGTLWIVNGGHSTPFAEGYAGRGVGRNNPEAEDIKGIGPLPQGKYRMRVLPHPRFAGPAIYLTPEADNEMYGRSEFFIHGDDGTGNASRGCIVVPRSTRLCISALIDVGFDMLIVKP